MTSAEETTSLSESKRPHVLLVEDEGDVRQAFRIQLEQEGYEVVEAATGGEAFDWLQKLPFDVLVTDVQMPGLSGIDLIERLSQMESRPVTVVMTGYGTIEMAVKAVRAGAFEFLQKPFSVDVLTATVASALKVKQLQEENVELRRSLRGQYGFDRLISNSEVMKEVYRLVECVADSDSTVLILGESGTGKELLAQTVHFNSPRKHKSLVPVNCGAIPESLLESELFGHEKGAFTGAIATRVGRFELATGGTIFLDEIGDLSPPLQVKLLRVLQERTFERVGGTRTLRTDARVIAATNQDLEELVAKKQFREDLFYRLNVVPIVLPPLRQRSGDIPLLVDHFIRKLNEQRGSSLEGGSPEVMMLLTNYQWPGNIRELGNLIERLAILKRSGIIEPVDLPEKIRHPGVGSSPPAPGIPVGGIDLGRAVEEFENRLIIEALERSNWVKSKAAQLLQINRTTLIEKLKRKSLVEVVAQRSGQTGQPEPSE